MAKKAGYPIWLLGILAFAGLLALCGCGSKAPPTPTEAAPSGAATVTLSHAPAHPTGAEAVSLEAAARGTVDRIVLSYQRYELSSGTGGVHQQTLAASETLTTCDPVDLVTALDCAYTMPAPFPDASLVRISAVAYDGSDIASEDAYSFAAGDYPWPSDPIPVRVNGAPLTHLDVILIPANDIDENTLRSSLTDVIEGIYFGYRAIRSYSSLYNFYYSGVSGTYTELCKFTKPSNMATLQLTADTVAFLHSANLRDCRSGSVMSSEITNDKSLIHETGHALYDLQDEYCCDSSYSPQNCVPNLWKSLEDCEAYAPTAGLQVSDCTQLASGSQTKPYWFVDPKGSSGCLMGNSQHFSGSDFGPACELRIYWRYDNCLSGDCMPWPACP